jgi:hypothetical protein
MKPRGKLGNLLAVTHRQQGAGKRLGDLLLRSCITAAALCTLLAGCTARKGAETATDVLFDGTLAELVPHHDGDEFIFRYSGGGTDNGFYVQNVSVSGGGREIETSLSANGTLLSRTTFLAQGSTLAITREEFRTADLVLVYGEPMPAFSVPLRSGMTHTRTPVTLQRLSSGETLAEGEAVQRITVSRGPVETGLDTYALLTERRLQLGTRLMQMRSASLLKPGLGAVMSEGSADGGPVSRQELVCATIAGRRIGTCPGE